MMRMWSMFSGKSSGVSESIHLDEIEMLMY